MAPMVSAGAATLFVVAALVIGLCVGLSVGHRIGYREGSWSATHTALRRRQNADRPPGAPGGGVW